MMPNHSWSAGTNAAPMRGKQEAENKIDVIFFL